MNTGLLAAFVIVAVGSLLMGFCIGVLVESNSLRKWYDERLDIIEERYKRKYGEGSETPAIAERRPR
jgi:hypothetical protein